ncbi:MAG: hypothetical protein AABY32_00205 [Nanoarchaeota archaeon]
MVLQYKLKNETRWKKYPGKSKMKVSINKCYFRLLNEVQTKVLVEKGNYEKVMKRFRQIEFFKHRG